MLHIDCGKFYDGETPEVREEIRIRIDEGRVKEVGPIGEITPPESSERVDHLDEFVMPGLIDAHLHIDGSREMGPLTDITEFDRTALKTARATSDLKTLLSSGFTTIRDLSSSTGLGLRDAIEEGEIEGPRIYTSGMIFSQTAGHDDLHFLPYRWMESEEPIVDGPTECRRGARKRIRQGVDVIKISTTGGVLSEKDEPHHPQFTDQEIQAFTEEAHRVGIPVASHAQGAQGIKNALRNGVDTIEHACFLDDEAVDLFHETGSIMVPTLAIMERITQTGQDFGIPDWGMRKAEDVYESHIKSTKKAYREGIPIAAGTDFMGPEMIPHGKNAMELELFVEKIGMDPIDALHTATGVAKQTVPDDDIGSITIGDHADIVVLSEDPREDMSAVITSIDTVYKGGEAV